MSTNPLVKKLTKLAHGNFNVMLVGSHGIGKSTVVKAVAEDLNYVFKYYSSSTMDVYSELIGLPVPGDKEEKVIDYYRPRDVHQAEFIFFDEMNRAHPRVLNAILEIIQFKSINGVPLPNLKMVWAAINPPGEDYQVEDLDPALVDRFHAFIKMKAEMNVEYLSSVMSTELAQGLADWWEEELNDQQRRILTPRRMEYIGTMVESDVPWRDALPQGHEFPSAELDQRIRAAQSGETNLLITKETILQDPSMFIEKLVENPQYAIKIANFMTKFDQAELFKCRDLLESLPKDLVSKVSSMKFAALRRNFRKPFDDEKIDITNYPKISEVYGFENV